MLLQKSMRVVNFVQSDVKDKVLLGQGHILIHLQGLVKVTNFTKFVQEFVNPLLIVVDKRIGG